MQRGAIAEVGARLDPKLPGGELRTDGTEGLALRVRGDGHFYLAILETSDGSRCAFMTFGTGTRTCAHHSSSVPACRCFGY